MKAPGEQSPSLPAAFCTRIAAQFPVCGGALLEALDALPVTSIHVHPTKGASAPDGLPVPWFSRGRILSERPSFTLDPSYHAGAYYPQESSSMFLAHVTEYLFGEEEDLRFLDLCASPGGKSLILSSFLGERGQLVANEIHRSRNAVLRENLTRWGIPNYVVTQADAAQLGRAVESFDLVLVDAPCSGEGMFRKDPASRLEWSPENVSQCAIRQRSILEDIAPAVRPGGYLIYSTCTFSAEENEEQLRALIASGEWEIVDIPCEENWHIEQVRVGQGHGYRFIPGQVAGEGFFLAVLQKSGSNGRKAWRTTERRSPYWHALHRSEKAPLVEWITRMDGLIVSPHNEVFASPFDHDEIHALSTLCIVTLAGQPLGTIKKNFVPSHGLAMSSPLRIARQEWSLSREQALQYLRCQPLERGTQPTGWTIMTWEGNTLGWSNVLANRVNNYYPQEWRIKHL